MAKFGFSNISIPGNPDAKFIHNPHEKKVEEGYQVKWEKREDSQHN